MPTTEGRVAGTGQNQTYAQYHDRRLVERVPLLASVAAIGCVIEVIWADRPHGLPLMALFATVALASFRWPHPSALALHTASLVALAIDMRGFGNHYDWVVLSVIVLAALAPLRAPAREGSTALWIAALAFDLWHSQPDAYSASAVAAAIAMGWTISWANHRSWRRTWEDAQVHKALNDRLSSAHDALSEAVSQTRTELAAQHDRLVHQERLATLGRLAAGIAHEINNPLAVAMTNLDLAITGGDPDPVLLADARQSLKRIKNIVADLSKVARPGDVDQVAAVPLDQVLAYAADVARVIVKGQMRIRVMTTPGVLVLGNRTRLEQVFVNLLVNAWQAMSGRGRGQVVIGAREGTSRVTVYVDDDGPGIPAHMSNEIFEPFFTTKGPGEGSGLGLAISRSYMRAMGGDVTASRSPMGGARFTITIPVAQTLETDLLGEGISLPAPGTERADNRPAPGRKGTLLVIDDEPALRRSLERALRHDWRVLTAANGAEAEAHLLSDHVDVVLCDLVLADEDGIDVLRALARRDPRILMHAVLMSGEPAGQQLQMARSNAGNLVRKPFDLDELKHRLREARSGHWTPIVLDTEPHAKSA